MRLERTQDAELIKSVVVDPSIWPHVSEDCADIESWEPLIHDQVYQLAIYDDAGFGGCFILTPESSICWQVHTCILPSHRGEKARQATRLCAEWMFSNTPCQHIITRIPSYNKPAYKLATDTGLKPIGLIECAWAKNGEFFDVHLLGVKKWPPHQQ